MWLPFVGILFGLLVGVLFPVSIPAALSPYVSIAVLAAMDSLLGGIRADLEKRFDFGVFITGFIGNALLAAGLSYLGDRLDVQLYLAAIFAFGVRMFANFAVLRRIALDAWRKHRKTMKKEPLESEAP